MKSIEVGVKISKSPNIPTSFNKSKNLILYLKQPIELEKQLPTIQILKEF